MDNSAMAIFENEVQRQFNELLEDCSHFNETEKTLVIKSYEFASEAHKGVRRKSGEPYIIHPLSVAKIAVVEIGLGAKAIAAALLHDVVEDTQYTLEDIENSFGKEIAVIVDGLTKISGVFHENISAQAENFRKILLTISEDVRVILIKLADRLHNMRTLDSMAPHKQMKIAGETIYFFVPLANRFGLYEIKKELENLSLKYRFPTIYREIQNKMLEYENIREFYINNFVKPLRDKLDKDGYRYVIIREPRSIYSIWLEMQTENLSFEQVYDALSLTIVFEPHPEIPEKTQCWAIYALITDVYIPKPECLRDYVSKPKANGYEALHATFMGPNGKWVDVFIRSIRMNMIAERGFAPMLEKRNFSEDAELTKWMDKLSSYLSEQNENAVEFVDDFTLNLYSQEILVFTPKGQLRTLPLGSTVLDFAFDIHSEIGFKSIAAKVNHKLVSLNHKLTSGDQVEIITGENVRITSEWLDYVTNSKAKNSIKKILKLQHKDKITAGEKLLEEYLKKHDIEPSIRTYRNIFDYYNVRSKDELFTKISTSQVLLDNLDDELRKKERYSWMRFWGIQLNTNSFLSFKTKTKPVDDVTLDPGTKQVFSDKLNDKGLLYKMANCCKPIPGDQCVGYRFGDDIIVHKADCEKALQLMANQGNKIVAVNWTLQKRFSYVARVKIEGIDNFVLLRDIMTVISKDLNVRVKNVSINNLDGVLSGHIDLYTSNVKDIKSLIDNLSKVQGLVSVKRIDIDD